MLARINRKFLRKQFYNAPVYGNHFDKIEETGRRLDNVRMVQQNLKSDWSKAFWHQVEQQLVRRLHQIQIESI